MALKGDASLSAGGVSCLAVVKGEGVSLAAEVFSAVCGGVAVSFELVVSEPAACWGAAASLGGALCLTTGAGGGVSFWGEAWATGADCLVTLSAVVKGGRGTGGVVTSF